MVESSELTFADRFRAVAGDQPFAWGARHGLDKAFVANCLRGKSRPQKKNLDKLVGATGIQEDWWLHGRLPPPLGGYEHPTRLAAEDPAASSNQSWVRPGARNKDDPRLRMALALQLGRSMGRGGWCPSHMDLDTSDRIISRALAALQAALAPDELDNVVTRESALDAALRMAHEATSGPRSTI